MFFDFEVLALAIVARLIARPEAGEKLTKKAIISQLSPSFVKRLLELAPAWTGSSLKKIIKIQTWPGYLDVRAVLNCRFCESARLNDLVREYGPRLIIPTVAATITLHTDWKKVESLSLDEFEALYRHTAIEFKFLHDLSLEGEMWELKNSCPHRAADD